MRRRTAMFIKREIVERLRKQYPAGTRVEVLEVNGITLKVKAVE